MAPSISSDDNSSLGATECSMPDRRLSSRILFPALDSRSDGELCSLASTLVVTAPEFPPSADCDLVLRSTKTRPHMDFYVKRSLIYDKSPYLRRQIMQLGSISGRIDIITCHDDAENLRAMLSFIHADHSKPAVRSVGHLRTLLKAACQYEIEAAKHTLGTSVLLDYAQREPIRAYAIACEFGLTDEAVLISKYTLEVDIMSSDRYNDLGRVSLSYYHRLVHLHRQRARAAIDILCLIDAENPMDEDDPPFCRGCGTNATWWQIFVEYGCAELQRRPVSTTVFSHSFLAKCVRTSAEVCKDCPESYFGTRSQRLLTRLKEDIDALPIYIMPASFSLGS